MSAMSIMRRGSSTSPLVGEVGTRSVPGEGETSFNTFLPLTRLAALPLATLSHKGRGKEPAASVGTRS